MGELLKRQVYELRSQMKHHENQVFIWDFNKEIFELCQLVMKNYNNFDIDTDKKFVISDGYFVFKYKKSSGNGDQFFIKITDADNITEDDIYYYNDCTGVSSNIVLMRTKSDCNDESYYLVFSNDFDIEVSETTKSKELNVEVKTKHSNKKCDELTSEEINIIKIL